MESLHIGIKDLKHKRVKRTYKRIRERGSRLDVREGKRKGNEIIRGKVEKVG